MNDEDYYHDFGDPNPVIVQKTYTETDLREAKAQALEDAADEYRHYQTPNARLYLRARAAAVRKSA